MVRSILSFKPLSRGAEWLWKLEVVADFGYLIPIVSSPKQKRYGFEVLSRCNMCQSSGESHRFVGRRLDGAHGMNPRKKLGLSTSIVRCRDCGLVFANPMPLPLNFDEHYAIDPELYWRQNESQLLEAHDFSRQIAIFRELFPGVERPKALDIGAGLGKCMVALEAEGFEVCGFEASRPFYQAAIDRTGIDPEKIELNNIHTAEYEPESFHFILFGAVLEHLDQPSESIQKAIRWLKPGGLIFIEVPSSRWLISRLANLYYRLTLTDFACNISPMHPPFHLYEFTLKSFQKNGALQSYRVARHQYHGCSTYLPKFLARFLDPIVKPFMKLTQTGMQLEIWLTK